MKTIPFYLLLAITFFYGCTDPIIIEEPETEFESLWIPPNAKITKGDEWVIEAPEGWAYVGYVNGSLKMANDGKTSVSCDCSTSGNCSPFAGTGPGGSTAGCAGNCKKCTMTQSLAGEPIKFDEGGYINLNLKPSFIEKGQSLPLAFDAMFEVEEVANLLKDFIEKTYDGHAFPELNEDGSLKDPEKFVFAMVNVCDRAAAVIIPTSAALSNGAIYGGNASCDCTEGSCSLKSVSIPFVGGVKYCEGDCTGTCTLTTSLFFAGSAQEEVVFKAVKYRY